MINTFENSVLYGMSTSVNTYFIPQAYGLFVLTFQRMILSVKYNLSNYLNSTGAYISKDRRLLHFDFKNDKGKKIFPLRMYFKYLNF